MVLFGKRPDPAKMKERIERAEQAYAFVTQEWEIGAAGASTDEQHAELAVYIDGGQVEWYPPNYAEKPHVDDGKLKVKTVHNFRRKLR